MDSVLDVVSDVTVTGTSHTDAYSRFKDEPLQRREKKSPRKQAQTSLPSSPGRLAPCGMTSRYVFTPLDVLPLLLISAGWTVSSSSWTRARPPPLGIQQPSS